MQLQKLKLPWFIVGDINIDLAKFNSHTPTSNYLENLLCYNVTPTILMPTRITEQSATIIDHIYYSPGRNFGSDLNIQSGNLWSDLTDHLPNFCLLTSKNSKQQNEERPFIRIYSASNIHKFTEKIKNCDWTEIFHCTDANLAYMNFEKKLPLLLMKALD